MMEGAVAGDWKKEVDIFFSWNISIKLFGSMAAGI